jgi:lipopolysaccharide/colanic/teichoic acid biosynthesis glycosyltransferase
MKTVAGTTQTVVRYVTLVTKWLDAAKILALIVLVIYLPALMAIALAVVLTSKGPAFINRCYRRPNGQLVDLWEFRTECWERWEPTKIGTYLRQANMHRLPALVNVLRGDVEPGERVKAAQTW